MYSNSNQKKNSKNPTSVKAKAKTIDHSKELQESNFQQCVLRTSHDVNIGNDTIYSFEVYEMEGQNLIATIMRNTYYLYCLDVESAKLDLIKQEKVELVNDQSKVIRINIFFQKNSIRQTQMNKIRFIVSSLLNTIQLKKRFLKNLFFD